MTPRDNSALLVNFEELLSIYADEGLWSIECVQAIMEYDCLYKKPRAELRIF